jgi:hypothetical protein
MAFAELGSVRVCLSVCLPLGLSVCLSVCLSALILLGYGRSFLAQKALGPYLAAIDRILGPNDA